MDSAAYQQALVALLAHDDESIRSPVAVALAYSAPPTDAIESLLLDRTANESSQGLKAAVLGAMGQAGYRSDRFVAATLALIQPDVDTRAIYTAAQVLALAQSESALDTLISLASKNSPSQQYSLRALAAYGHKAARAKPVLERLLTDQAVPEDIRNLIRMALEAITTGKPQASNLQPMNLVSLWPVSMTAPEPVVNQQAPKTVPKSPSITPSAQSKQSPALDSPSKPENDERRRAWPWVTGAVVLVLAWLVVLKRRPRK